MRRMLLVAVALLGLAACSDNKPPAANPPAGSSSPDTTGTTPPDATPTGAPGTAPPGEAGTAKDKAACTAIVTKLSDWGLAFSNAVGGLGDAGNDAAKVDAVVKQAKAANSKFAGELRAEAAKTNDAQVKKVANDLAAAFDKANTQMDPQKIAKDPGALMAGFDAPDYGAAYEAYEKVCGGA